MSTAQLNPPGAGTLLPGFDEAAFARREGRGKADA